MSEDLDIEDYAVDDNDVTLDQDQKHIGGSKQDWLKFQQKGQLIRGAFVYLYTVDVNAAHKAQKDAQKAGKKLSSEEVLAVAKDALTKRAEALNKTVAQLTTVERLDTTVAHFKSLRAHFHDEVGYVISRIGKDGAEADQVWRQLGDVKPYFTTLLLIYPTDSEGVLNKDALGAQVAQNKLKLMPWRFSKKTYDIIYGLNEGLRENGLSLALQDVKIECDNPKFQGVKVNTAGPATWQKNEKMKTAVLTAAVNMYDKLVPFRELTTDQLREKLGHGSSAGGASSEETSTDNFNDWIDNV